MKYKGTETKKILFSKLKTGSWPTTGLIIKKIGINIIE
jgi:hypothetical protein